LTALTALTAAAQSNSDSIVQRAAGAYQALSSFQADFRQIIADSMIGTYESTGRLIQAGTSTLSMRFSDPKGDAIVMDGQYLWLYTPSTTPGQVIRTPIAKDATYGPNVLAWLLTRPTERYSSQFIRRDAVGGRGADVISLVPRDPSLPFAEAELWIDQSDYLPRRLEVQDRNGTRRTLIFTGVETNHRITKDTFTFSVPAGTRVIDQ
jgi:outer membrane lipoprotein carrier protein